MLENLKLLKIDVLGLTTQIIYIIHLLYDVNYVTTTARLELVELYSNINANIRKQKQSFTDSISIGTF